jgi:hypothetical protein
VGTPGGKYTNILHNVTERCSRFKWIAVAKVREAEYIQSLTKTDVPLFTLSPSS